MDGAITEEERLAFMRKSYFIAAMYIIATLAQTILTVMLAALHDFVLNNYYLALLGLVLVFVCCVVLYIVHLKSPYNIIVVILLVESLTVAVVTVSALCTPTLVLGSYATAITAAVVVSLVSVFIATDITKAMDVLRLGILINFVFWITMIIMITTILRQKVFTVFSVIILLLAVFILLVYHTQVICGNKFALIERYGTNGASVIIYLDVTVAYILILELYKRSLWKAHLW